VFEAFIDEDGRLLPGVMENGKEAIIVSYAGYSAETNFDSSASHDQIARLTAGCDFENIEKITRALELKQSEVEQLKHQTSELVKKHWKEIEGLAEILMDEKTIEGDAAEIICDYFAGDDEISGLVLRHYPFLSKLVDNSESVT